MGKLHTLGTVPGVNAILMNITTYNLKEIERQVIISCLNKHRTYSLKEIAVLLGISERTLYRKLEELGLQFGHVSKRPIIKSAN